MSDNNFRKGPHAAKNKSAQDIIDGKISSVDERKTVVLDEDLENVEFDDKVWLYWKRNRSFIIFTIVAAFAIIIGTQSWKMYNAHKAAVLATAYETAHSSGDLHNFSAANTSTKLGALAALESADKLYSEGKFAEAKALYIKSSDALKNTVIFGRAKLGEAVCEYMANPQAAKVLLEKIFQDESIDAAFRAQAGYILAQAEISDGKNDSARKVLETIAKNPKNGVYARLAAEELSRLN